MILFFVVQFLCIIGIMGRDDWLIRTTKPMTNREFYVNQVLPHLVLPLRDYPHISFTPKPDFYPLSEQQILMLVALTGTGKSTAIDVLTRQKGFRLHRVNAIPARRDIADWVAIPSAQVLLGELPRRVTDRVQRFHYTKAFAEQVEGGMAAAFSWLYYRGDFNQAILSEGIRGKNEIQYTLDNFPAWHVLELALHPITRLKRLSSRDDAFDKASGAGDLSFMSDDLQAQALTALENGEISPKAITIMGAEAANYGLEPFKPAESHQNYVCLEVDDLSPDDVAEKLSQKLKDVSMPTVTKFEAMLSDKDKPPTLEIVRISARAYNIPLKSTLKWGQGHSLPKLAHVLIQVELSDGSIGFAESTPRPSIYGETQDSVIGIIDKHLAPILIGQKISAHDDLIRLNQNLQHIKNNHTAKGALDMALCHALSSVNAQYGMRLEREQTQVSYIVSTGSPDEVLEDVSEIYTQGVRVFKVKIGKDITQEIDTIRQLQTEFPAGEFYVDANECLSLENAAEILNQLYEMEVIHCEEALPVHLIRERHQLRQKTKMPIIADDSAFTLHDLERELAFDTFDILNIKTARTGFTISEQMLRLARSYGKDIMIGSQASSLLGCLHAALFSCHVGIFHATECSFFLKTDADLSFAPPIVDGWIQRADIETSLVHLSEFLRTQ